MAKSKQRGRPKTSKSNRVKVSIMLDPDLVDWSRDKRSDMVNRLLRLEFQFSKGGTVNLKPGMIEHVGPDKGEHILSDELLANLKVPNTEITGEQILKLITRVSKPPKDKQ